MPQLRSHNANKKQVILPSTKDLPPEDQAWVVVDVSPATAADTLDITEGMGSMRILITLLANRIVEWNYTDENGVAIPITFDSVCRFDIEDLKYLANMLPNEGDDDSRGLTEEQKKTSSDTTEPKQAGTNSIPVSHSQ